MIPSLAERLKTETRELHTAAERSVLMRELLHGRLSRGAYCELLANLHSIYGVLEPALVRHRKMPVIAPVYLPALLRTRALEDDLTALHGNGWQADLALTPAAREYGKRLREIEELHPALLLAHAYVRYLGDLSGGQLLRSIVARSVSPDGVSGLAFYDFGDASQTRELKQAFRAGITRVGLDEQGVAAIVAEARCSFQQHARLFDELARAHGLV